MYITKIEEQVNNPDRVNIFIDGRFALGLSEELRYLNGLREGQEIDPARLEELVKKEEFQKAMEQALNFLSFRKRSRKEVYDRLRKSDFPEETILSVLDRCQDLKYIDDYSFAESFIKDKTNINKHGSRRIKQELRLKGISDEIINSFEVDQEAEYEMALRLAEKRVRSYKNDDYQKKYRKLSGYLARRGYDYSIISDVLKEVLSYD